MDTNGFQPTVEKNAQDIQALTRVLADLTNNVHSLLKAQKDLRNLFRSQIEHNMEIQSLKVSVHQLSDDLHRLNERINALETHQLTVAAASKARSSLVDTIAKYGPVVATALLALISIVAILAIKELGL